MMLQWNAFRNSVECSLTGGEDSKFEPPSFTLKIQPLWLGCWPPSGFHGKVIAFHENHHPYRMRPMSCRHITPLISANRTGINIWHLPHSANTFTHSLTHIHSLTSKRPEKSTKIIKHNKHNLVARPNIQTTHVKL